MEVFNFERDQKAIENLHEILFGNYNVVVITGAGISTLSGISDFRGINGLYTRNPENIKKFYSIDYIEEVINQNFEVEAETAEEAFSYSFRLVFRIKQIRRLLRKIDLT